MPRGHILFSQEKDAKVIQGGGGWLPHSLSFMAMSFLPTQPSWEYSSVAPWPPLPLGKPPVCRVRLAVAGAPAGEEDAATA